MTTIVLILLWLYFCMMFVMIGAQVNHYFEEKFRRFHQIATEAIRREYQQLLKSEEEEPEEKTGEKEDSR